MKKRQYQFFSIIKVNMLATFHEEKIIFDKISGHLLFYRAQMRVSDSNLGKKAIIFEMELLVMPNFNKIFLI